MLTRASVGATGHNASEHHPVLRSVVGSRNMGSCICLLELYRISGFSLFQLVNLLSSSGVSALSGTQRVEDFLNNMCLFTSLTIGNFLSYSAPSHGNEPMAEHMDEALIKYNLLDFTQKAIG